MYNFFAYINRLKYINRWSLMKNVRNENIMEHSYMTAVVAHALAVIGNAYFGASLNPERVAVSALFHDMSEALTGDLPTPVKYFNPEINAAYKGIESVAEQKLLSMLPPEMSPFYKRAEDEGRNVKCAEDEKQIVKGEEDEKQIVKCAEDERRSVKCAEEEKRIAKDEEDERRIVKCADKLCAYIKCLEELQVSNREFARAECSVAKEIEALNCPEADYFMEHFIPSFKLSLDELE